MASNRCLIASLAVGGVWSETTSIYKEDFPEAGLCGEEVNVSKSTFNPHWFFPMYFGGYTEGNCSDIGYTKYNRTEEVAMHPVPGVHHNLSFDLYSPTQSKTVIVEMPDPSRKNRIVKIKLCMPLNAGKVPLYIFGHGAGCAPEDYEYFCQAAAVASVYQDSKAGSIFPADFDTANEAIDAAFLSATLPEVSKTNQSSPLFGKLDGNVIMGGHSMGGGLTVLSVGMNKAPVNGVALFAPGLYTQPSGTPYLQNISVPALVVSGSMDCGQNALDKQAQPAFNGLASSSKVLVVLKGANHCQWIQPLEKGLGVCSTFEKNECHAIPRADQHRLGTRLLAAFAEGAKSPDGWAKFEETLASGEAAGTWSYFSSKTSPANKTVHNDCPCASAVEQRVVV